MSTHYPSPAYCGTDRGTDRAAAGPTREGLVKQIRDVAYW